MDWFILYRYRQTQLVEYVTKGNRILFFFFWSKGNRILEYAARGKENTTLWVGGTKLLVFKKGGGTKLNKVHPYHYPPLSNL